jgi:transposase
MSDAVRHDRRRQKTTSNKDWESHSDKDARIVRMKDGTTRLGYKPEHVIDMESGVILAAPVYAGDKHDATTILSSLATAEANIAAIRPDDSGDGTIEGEPWHKQPRADVVADKGYHKVSTLLELKENGYRSYIPEKKHRGRRRFTDKGGVDAARAFHGNRARTRRAKGKALQRRRGELLERPNQHLYDRTGLRHLTVTGHAQVQKRIWLQAAAFNLGAVMRKTLGAGTPKRLAAALVAFCAALCAIFWHASRRVGVWRRRSWQPFWDVPPLMAGWPSSENGLFTPAC